MSIWQSLKDWLLGKAKLEPDEELIGSLSQVAPSPASDLAQLLGQAQYDELLKLANDALASSKMPLPADFGNDDKVAVYCYTHQDLRGIHYRALNGVLWGENRPNKVQLLKFAEFLTAALRKLPAFDGFVYRVASFDVTITRAHTPGGLVTYPAFASSSTEGLIAPPGGSDVVIGSTNGRFIGGLSRFPGESEVLFEPGTVFQVLTSEKRGV